MKALCLVLVAACASSSSKPIDNKVATKIDARAYELGKGVSRDYRVAAKLYRENCAEGCGDLPSCRAYLDLAMESRGAVATTADIPLIAHTCDRGDAFACLLAAMGAIGAPENLEKLDHLSERCDDGDIKACQAEIETDLGMSDSGTHEDRMQRLRLRVCSTGVIALCISAIEYEWSRCVSVDSKEPGQPCIDAAVAGKTSASDPQELTLAWKRVTDACTDGDALACAVVPGREIAKRERCKAGDYGICAKLAKDGDKDAAGVACAGGVTEQCTPSNERRDSPLVARGLVQLCEQTGEQKLCDEAKRLTAVSPCPLPPATSSVPSTSRAPTGSSSKRELETTR